MKFDGILDKKRSLSGLQKCHSKIAEKFAFSHGERFPRVWSKSQTTKMSKMSKM